MVYEVPKEMLDKVYEAIEVAKTTGKIKKEAQDLHLRSKSFLLS